MKRTFRIGLLAIAVSMVVMVAADRTAWGCPNCKEAVSLQEGEAENLSSGYNWSVMFMLVVPFSMMGTGAFAIHRAVRRGSFPEM